MLKNFGIGKGLRVCTFPKYKEELSHDYRLEEQDVVVDENLITSQGPATAFKFAFTIVEKVLNTEKAQMVWQSIGFSGREQ